MNKSIIILSLAAFKRNPRQIMLLGLCLALSTLLISSSVGLLVNMGRPFDLMFDQLNASHLLLIYDYREHDTKEIQQWLGEQAEVQSVAVPLPVVSPGSAVIFQNKELELDLQLTERIPNANGQDQVSFMQGETALYPELGDIWIPDHLAQSHGIVIGDTVEIPTDEGLFPLRVSATLVDPHYVSGLFNPSRAWIAPGSLPFIFLVSQLTDVSLGIRLQDASHIGEVLQRFHQEFPFEGRILEHGLFKSVFMSFYQIIGLILMIFSFMGIICSLFFLFNALSAAISKEHSLIGLYASIGFTPQGIQNIYLFRYVFLAMLSIPAGLLGGYMTVRYLFHILASSVGLPDLEGLFTLPLLISGVSMLTVIWMLIYGLSSRASRIKPISALRSDPSKGERPIGMPAQLWQWEWLPSSMLLGISLLLSNPRRTLLTGLSLTIAILMMVFAINVAHSFANLKDQKAAWGLEDADLHVRRNESVALPLDPESMYRLLSAEANIESVTPYHYVQATVLSQDQKGPRDILGKAYEGKIETLGLQNLIGKHPQTSDEIALCLLTARELNRSPGDSLVLFIEGQKKQFVICGIYQDISQLGRGFRLSETAMKALNPLFESHFFAIRLTHDHEVSEVEHQLEARYGETMLIEQKIEDRMAIRQTISSMQAALSLIVFFFLTILFLILLNDTLVTIRDLRASLGILKAIGMLGQQLQWSQIYRFLLLGSASILIGIPLGMLVSPVLISQLTQHLGLAEFPFLFHRMGTILIIPGILLFVSFSAWIASRTLNHQTPKQLIFSHD